MKAKIYTQYLKYSPDTAKEGLYDHDAPTLIEGYGWIVKNISIRLIQWQSAGLGFSLYPVIIETLYTTPAELDQFRQELNERVKELNTKAGLIDHD